MAAPVIGITANDSLAQAGKASQAVVGDAYIQSVVRAGGLPLIIPVGFPVDDLERLFPRLDGVLLTGGADIEPGRFGGRPHPSIYGIDERRDELEIRLVRRSVENGTPFLGICRGIQVVNVALGGTLYTDIADQLPNARKHNFSPDYPHDHLAHRVSVEPGTRLAGLLQGETVEVNSLHHQGIDRLAQNLVAAAYAPDRLVEAVELPGHPFALAVQWHPEWLQADAAQRALFQGLVEAAAQAGGPR